MESIETQGLSDIKYKRLLNIWYQMSEFIQQNSQEHGQSERLQQPLSSVGAQLNQGPSSIAHQKHLLQGQQHQTQLYQNQPFGLEPQAYGQYQQPYDQPYDYQQEYQPSLQLMRQMSTTNAQYQLNQLLTRINKQCQQINELTYLGQDWSMALYMSCGWNKKLCDELMLTPEQKHKALIGYTVGEVVQGDLGQGECALCLEPDRRIYRNICGHQCCEDCWRGNLEYCLRGLVQPFPNCINGEQVCRVKYSYTLCQMLVKDNPDLAELFERNLCRSYAIRNPKVKVCKGRQGINCNKVFTITKMFDIIECETCGNLVCPRCGQRYHGINQCYDLINWAKITEQSTDFVEFLNYKQCPSCKQVIERPSGCNSMVCRCKQQFCFVCGEKWLPNHTQHGDTTCYRYNQILALNKERQRKRQNQKQFFFKVQDRRTQLDTILVKYARICQERTKDLPVIKKALLDNYTFYESQLGCLEGYYKLVQRTHLFIYGQVLTMHFNQNEEQKARCGIIESCLNSIEEFTAKLKKLKDILIVPADKRCIFEELALKQQTNFPQWYMSKTKQVDGIIRNIEVNIGCLMQKS